jgi:hypothetical protein
MCRAGSSADAHTWPSAGHARHVLPQAFYALTESWNGSGRGSRHPTPPRMKKRWAEPPRDQPGANSASCSPAERRQETAAGARPAAMAESSWTLLRASPERQSDGFAGDRSRVRGGKVGGSPLGQADPSGTHHRSLATRIPGSAPSKKERIR